jgi:Predicted membrane protein (DUF2157)
MTEFQEKATQTLFEKNLISEEEFSQIKAYRKLGIFSLHNELRGLLYLSVTLFTSGIGILIYQNIDTIGHQVLLGLLFLTIVVCYYFCFKNAPKFDKKPTEFKNSLYDYLLLLATILTCTFIGYLQFQYKTFGTQYGLATLLPTVIAFACAYYFDNKSILSIAITGLAAYIGLTVNPQALLQSETFDTNSLGFSAILLGVALVIWSIYCEKIDLKKHFGLVFNTFALHLISIACLTNMTVEYYWFVYALVLAGSTYYFFKISHISQAVSLYIFTLLYGFIGLNIVLARLLDAINFDHFISGFFFLIPIYFILSIVGFIKLLKNFKK